MAAPTIGAHQEGFKGFAKGAAAGEGRSAAEPWRSTCSPRLPPGSCLHTTTRRAPHHHTSTSTVKIPPVSASPSCRPPAGLAGAVILPVAGVAVGGFQVVRGAANTPLALKQAAQGKHWDQASAAATLGDMRLPWRTLHCPRCCEHGSHAAAAAI